MLYEVITREAHAAWLGGDTELVEQRDEMGIGAVVEDDETRVDLVAPAALLDTVSVSVAADVAGRFVHGDVVRRVQPVADHVPGDVV